MRSRTVRSPDGLELFVRERGDPASPPMLLVHGYPDTGAVWDRVARRLADRFHVVVPDVRGSGSSDAPTSVGGYALDRLVGDLGAVLGATVGDDRPVHLVGHDWGSIQAWEALTGPDLPGRFASFTSLSGPSLDHVGHWLRTCSWRDRARQAPRSWYVAAFHTPLGPLPWRRGLADRWPKVLGDLERLDPAAVRAAPTMASDGVNGIGLYVANVRDRLQAPRARRTDVPVQLIVATGDRFVTPSLADAALAHCTTVRRRTAPDGHWGLLLDRPGALADAVITFADDVEDGPMEPGVDHRTLP